MSLPGTGNPSVRRYFLSPILAFFLLLAPRVGAQQDSPAQKFTARTELVTVPVIVLSHGKHVTGLHKADFEIEEDGHAMSLASFEEIGLAQSAKPIAPPPGIYTNEVLADGPVTMTILVLDLINTPFLYQEAVKRELLDYLQRSYRADRPTMLAILSRSGLKVIHDFTNDPQVLETLVRHLKQEVKHDLEADNVVQKNDSGTLLKQIDASAEYEALEKEFFGDPSVAKGEDSFAKLIEDNDREATLLELRQLARGLTSLPGMKSLIWVSGGIVLLPAMDSRSVLLREQYEDTLKLLNAATVVVTPIDTVLESSNPGFRDTMNMLPDSRNLHLPLTPGTQRVQNFWDLAQRTGGDYCLMRRDRDCFRKMSDLTSHYYLLTYYAKPSEKNQWRKLHVKVQGENLDVKARSGYYSIGVANGDPEERRKRDVAEASLTPVEFRGIPISARWSDTAGKAQTISAGTAPFLEKRNKRNFQLGMAPGALSIDEADRNHIRLHIVVLAMNDKGKVLNDVTQQLDLHPTRDELQRIRAHGFLYGNEMEIPAATTRLRFIVRDDLSENVGTVSMPVM